MIALVVGVVAVLAIAFFAFSGGGSGSAAPGSSAGISPGTPKTTSAASSPAATVTSAASATKSSGPVTIRTTVPVTVPPVGVVVKVSYLGGYSGTYGFGSDIQKVKGSGDNVYQLNATSGTLQATFQKLDGSSRHDLTVEFWKGGSRIAAATNTSGFGIVTLQSAV